MSRIREIFLVILAVSLAVVLFKNAFLKIDIYKQNTYVAQLTEQVELLNHEVNNRDSLLVASNDKNEELKGFVKDVLANPYGWATRYYKTMNVTGYHPVVEQCDSTPDITADGTKIDIDRAGDYRYVAVSRDMLRRWGGKVRFGDYILIKGTPDAEQDGIYQVRDTMNPRHKAWIDILLTPGQQSFYYKKVTMYRINNDDYLEVLHEIYDEPIELQQEKPQIIAMVDPEI